MLNHNGWKKYLKRQEEKSSLIEAIEKQFMEIDFNLNDSESQFLIGNRIKKIGDFVILQLFIEPLRGQFAGIEFRPKMFISHTNFTRRPRIYNDRRVFHPNINMNTCELVFPELVKQWNPTKPITLLLSVIKRIITEPNITFVPNTELNRRAAWNYRFYKKNYRILIIQNSPLFLQSLVGNELNKNLYSNMEMELFQDQQQQFWSIQQIIEQKVIETIVIREDITQQDDQSIDLLTKRIKLLQFEPVDRLISNIKEHQLDGETKDQEN